MDRQCQPSSHFGFWTGLGKHLYLLYFPRENGLTHIKGSLSDRFGKKWLIVVASVLGVVGSTVSGSAQHTHIVIVGNILTGMANAGCVSSHTMSHSLFFALVSDHIL